jgi:hypothetical protein
VSLRARQGDAFAATTARPSTPPPLRGGYAQGDRTFGKSSEVDALAEDAFPPEEARALRSRLLAYCDRDTLAMVRLMERCGAGDDRSA